MVVACAAAALSLLSSLASARIVWSGAATSSSARVSVEVLKSDFDAKAGTIHVAVREANSTNDPNETIFRSNPITDAGVFVYSPTSLKPETEYTYGVQRCFDPTKSCADISFDAMFRTFPPENEPWNFTVAFASCASTGAEHPIFDAIADASVASSGAEEGSRRLPPINFFLHMGDMNYADINEANSEQQFKDAFSLVHNSKSQSRLFKSMPLAYVWDDHDYGANNAQGDSVSKKSAQVAFRKIVPHYELLNAAIGSIQQALL